MTNMLSLVWFLTAHVLAYSTVNTCRHSAPYVWWLMFGIICILYLMLLEIFLIGLLIFILGPVIYVRPSASFKFEACANIMLILSLSIISPYSVSAGILYNILMNSTQKSRNYPKLSLTRSRLFSTSPLHLTKRQAPRTRRHPLPLLRKLTHTLRNLPRRAPCASGASRSSAGQRRVTPTPKRVSLGRLARETRRGKTTGCLATIHL